MTAMHADDQVAALRAFIDAPKTQHARRRFIVGLLWELIDGGPIDDPSGRATSTLVERTGWGKGRNSLHTIVASLSDVGLLGRDYNAKRTFRIEALVTPDDLTRAGYPRPGEPALRIVEHEPELEVEVEVEPEPAPKELPTFELPSSEVDTRGLERNGFIIEAVRLLMLAMSTASPAETHFEVTAHRLADALEDNARLRRKLDALGDAKRAVDAEVSGLRRASRLAQDNLDRMARNAFDPAKYRAWQELDRSMRQAPGGRGE